MSEFVTEIQSDHFQEQVLNESLPVIVDFWAPWCGPCKAMAPAFESLAETYADRVVFAKCNVDEQAPVAQRYGIKSIPTLMMFVGGKLVNSITGLVPKDVLETAIENTLSGKKAEPAFIMQ